MNTRKWAIVAVLTLFGCLPASARSAAAPDSSEVKLQKLSWADLQKHLATRDGAKWILIDAWATTCGPCKENFPHLVEMSRKYGPKGLVVISLSLDDPTDAKAIASAEGFLRDQKATFTNVLLDEEFGEGYEKLDISAIPAVFLYGPDGKEAKRFTMDDPNHQFTYEDVEREVVERLGE